MKEAGLFLKISKRDLIKGHIRTFGESDIMLGVDDREEGIDPYRVRYLKGKVHEFVKNGDRGLKKRPDPTIHDRKITVTATVEEAVGLDAIPSFRVVTPYNRTRIQDPEEAGDIGVKRVLGEDNDCYDDDYYGVRVSKHGLEDNHDCRRVTKGHINRGLGSIIDPDVRRKLLSITT